MASAWGVALLVGSAVEAYRAADGWSEGRRRLIGYGTAVLLGLAVGGALGLAALGVGQCGTWGETCEPTERDLMRDLSLGHWQPRWASPRCMRNSG